MSHQCWYDDDDARAKKNKERGVHHHVLSLTHSLSYYSLLYNKSTTLY